MNRFFTLRPGRLSYRSGLVLQTELLEKRLRGDADILILLEHTPVVTVGRGARSFQPLVPSDFFCPQRYRCGQGSEEVEMSLITGPGQVVGYPIVDLEATGRDLHLYLRMLEKVLLDTVASFAVEARTVEGADGHLGGGEESSPP